MTRLPLLRDSTAPPIGSDAHLNNDVELLPRLSVSVGGVRLPGSFFNAVRVVSTDWTSVEMVASAKEPTSAPSITSEKRAAVSACADALSGNALATTNPAITRPARAIVHEPR